MARYVFQKKDQIAGGRLSGEKTKRLGLGIHRITPGSPEHLENCRKGGLRSVQGVLNVASGEWDRIRNSPAAVEGRLEWCRSEENKTRCSEMGRLQGPHVDWEKVRTTESCQLGQIRGGKLSRCQRWHKNRGYYSLDCEICLEELSKSWGIPIEDEN